MPLNRSLQDMSIGQTDQNPKIFLRILLFRRLFFEAKKIMQSFTVGILRVEICDGHSRPV